MNKLEDIRNHVKEGSSLQQPAAKKYKQGINKEGTPHMRPKRNGGKKGN